MFDRYVAFAARQTPHLVAVSDGQQHISYREFDRAITGVASALSTNLGSGPGKTVGIAVRDGYRHALLALACARLGVASASLFAHAAVPLSTLVGATLLLTDDPDVDGVLIDQDWFARAGKVSPPVKALGIDLSAIGRVHLSSGSTGMPKAVEISWAAFDARITSGLFGNGDGMRRVLTLIGPESGALQLMITTWKHRGCVLFGPDTVPMLAAALPVLAPTGLLASPAQLAALLDVLPVDAAPFAGLEIAVGGGKLSRALADRAAVRLGARITAVYASSEAGTTALGYASAMPDDRAVGFLTPMTRVEIVDDDDHPVAAGAVGHVRIACPELAMGYRGDGEGAAFADGWFIPGDLGSLDETGTLRIVGRVDDVMNVGGEKFLPDMLEDKVRAVAGVADVAAFAINGEDGTTKVWLAIVRDGPVDEAAVGQAVAMPGLPTVGMAWIDAIPRTMMGKVRRDQLRTAAKALVG